MCRLYHAALEGKPLAHYEHISTLCIKGEPLAHNDVIGSVLQPFLVYVQANTKISMYLLQLCVALVILLYCVYELHLRSHFTGQSLYIAALPCELEIPL